MSQPRSASGTARIALLGLVSLVLGATARAAPDADPARVGDRSEQGRTVFAATCALCHGERGAGDGPAAAALMPRPADLSAAATQAALTDAHIARVIREGGAAVGRSAAMPAFAGQLGDADVDALVAWVRALGAPGSGGGSAPVAAGGTVSAPKSARFTPFSRTRFHLSGFASVRLDLTADAGPNFVDVTLSPVFLWRLHDRVLVEAETHLIFGAGAFEFSLGYAQIDLLPTDYTTVTAGLFLMPLGIYSERLHPGWVNRMVDAPYPYQGGHHGTYLPSDGVGLQLRGAVPLGENASFNYAAFVTNGPGEADGDLSLAGSVPDNNWNKLVGGRLGFLPARMVEVGVAAATGLWDDDETARYTAVVADLMAAHQGLALQGEGIFTFTDTADGETEARRLWWAQASYRFVKARGVLGMLEVVARAGGATLPQEEETHEHASVAAIVVPVTPLAGEHDASTSGALIAESGPVPGTSHQVGGGVNLYPLPSLAIRASAHYTFGAERGYVGLALAAGL